MDIRIKKGLDISLPGEAALEVATTPGVTDYAVKPTDFVGVVPKLLVGEGDAVEAGSPLFYDKRLPQVMFASPVKGVVKSIVRGEKRKLLAVVVSADQNVPEPPIMPFDPSSAEGLKELMCQSGVWTAIRQRPFGVVANPEESPKAIFVSACESYPLAPDAAFVLRGREQDFVSGLNVLTLLTAGKVHLCVGAEVFDQEVTSWVKEYCPEVELHRVSGPHPSGNVGTQIAAIDPINKGEVVWTVQLQDVVTIGHWSSTGCYRPLKRVALAGPGVRMPRYYELLSGACLSTLLDQQLLCCHRHQDGFCPKSDVGLRIISGDVFTGTMVGADGFLGAYDTLVTVLPEGDQYDFMGWLMPGLDKYSFSKTFLSGFTSKFFASAFWKKISNKVDLSIVESVQKRYTFNTNTHGSVRPLVVTGQFEKVFPLDIYPLQLIKACIVRDVELMEDLGIYEVEPEDFALCEFIDTSKTEIQTLVREALEYVRNS